MANKYDEMREAIRDARITMRAADDCADSLAAILDGRLRHVSHYRLVKLKRQLRDFNMRTRRWK